MSATIAGLVAALGAAFLSGYFLGTLWERERRGRVTDLSPAWQERVEALRRLIRSCKHAEGTKVNADGRRFCALCGRFTDQEAAR